MRSAGVLLRTCLSWKTISKLHSLNQLHLGEWWSKWCRELVVLCILLFRNVDTLRMIGIEILTKFFLRSNEGISSRLLLAWDYRRAVSWWCSFLPSIRLIRFKVLISRNNKCVGIQRIIWLLRAVWAHQYLSLKVIIFILVLCNLFDLLFGVIKMSASHFLGMIIVFSQQCLSDLSVSKTKVGQFT